MNLFRNTALWIACAVGVVGCAKEHPATPRPPRETVSVGIRLSSDVVRDVALLDGFSSKASTTTTTKLEQGAKLRIGAGGLSGEGDYHYFYQPLYEVGANQTLVGAPLYLSGGAEYQFVAWSPETLADAATGRVQVLHGQDFIATDPVTSLIDPSNAASTNIALSDFSHKCTRLEVVAVRSPNNATLEGVVVDGAGVEIASMSASPASYTIGGAIALDENPSTVVQLLASAFTPLTDGNVGVASTQVVLPKVEKEIRFSFNLELDGDTRTLSGVTPPMSLFAGVGYKFTIHIEEYVSRLTLSLTDWLGREIAYSMGGGTAVSVDDWVNNVLGGQVSMGSGTSLEVGQWSMKEMPSEMGAGTSIEVGPWTPASWSVSMGR